MRVLIADDEPEAVELVSSLLDEFSFISEKTTTSDPNQVRELVHSQKFDVAFLDIEYPGCSAFDLLKDIENLPRVVFISAHDKYAMKAIKHQAFDYLLKPVDPDEFAEVMDRIGMEAPTSIPGNDYLLQIQRILASGHNPEQNSRIAIPTKHGFAYHLPEEIVRIEADGSYTHVFFKTGKSLLVSRNLRDFEKALSLRGFIRIHRSHLINRAYVKAFSRIDGGIIEMIDGSAITLSKKYRDTVVDELMYNVEKI